MSLQTRLLVWTGLIIAICLTVLIYWPGVHGGFLLDDYSNIVSNPAIHINNLRLNTILAAAFSSHSGPLDRPISMLSFAINEYFWGPAPYSMKATNIVIHAINGLLIFAVCSLILKAYRARFAPGLNQNLLEWTTLAITAAWLLLPINLTSVLYVVQRMTSLSGSFVLLAIAMYLHGRMRMFAGKTGLWLILLGMILLGALGVMAKESGALLPVYTLIIEWILFGFRRPNGEQDKRIYGLYLIILVLPGILGLLWIGPSVFNHGYSGRPFTLVERLLTEPRVILDYIVWSLVPNLSVLSLYHDDFPFSKGLLTPTTTLLSIIAIVFILIFAIWQRRHRPLLSLGILWFLGGQLLTATIFPLELVFEHRNYLPDFGLLLALFSTTLLEKPVNRLALPRRALIVGLIGLYAGITALRVQEWSNPLRFAVISEAAHPHSPRATYGLGRAYAGLIKGARSPMIPKATAALEHASSVPHASILPASALLILSAKLKLPLKPSWWGNIDHTLASRPASPQDLNGMTAMVNCAMKGCNFPEHNMIRMFKMALDKNPNNADIITIYSNYVLNVLNNSSLALHLMQTAVKKAPTVSQYWINLTRLDIYVHNFKAAKRDIAHLQSLNHFNQLDDALKSLHKRLKHARNHNVRPITAPKIGRARKQIKKNQTND